MAEHETSIEAEGTLVNASTEADPVAKARALHHLATADPEPERDGLMTGPAHERKYSLEREEASAENWRARGVHPYKNGALEQADGSPLPESADAPKAAPPVAPPAE